MSWRADGGNDAPLFDAGGGRKYVTQSERRRFIAATRDADQQTATLCQLLALTGCRISEALALTSKRLDVDSGRVVFQTLKRRKVVYRAVPVPSALMTELLNLAAVRGPEEPLWKWCRQTAWRRVKRLMTQCGIRGSQAMPKGLRHGFGIANAQANVPPGLTQRWMGHARLETTSIYQDAMGEEEQTFAARLWEDTK